MAEGESGLDIRAIRQVARSVFVREKPLAGITRARLGSTLGKCLAYAVLIGMSFVALFPFLWMLSTSLKDTYSLYTFPPQFIPKNPTLANYVFLFTRTKFFIWLKNSAIVSGAITSFGLIFNSMAGYAFAKQRFIGREPLFLLILGVLMIPTHVLIVPVFLMLSKLDLIDTYWALILPGCASPFGIFLMRQYIETIPSDLIEAARIDGCSEFRIYWQIILPLCKPALAALGVVSFLGSWNSFLWPLIMTTKSEMSTLPVAIAAFQGQYATQWGVIMAGAMSMFLPVLIVFLALQRHFVEGIALTGVKG